jgi:type III pantothenate kinase
VNLVIDRGNTQLKIGIFDQYLLVHSDSTDILDKTKLLEWHVKFPITQIIYSSVVTNDDLKLIAVTLPKTKLIHLTHETPLPFNWEYKSKSTIGKDRLAAIAGAMQLYPNENVLVIDAGTAITYEFLSKTGLYKGGNISPGLNMRLKALHHFTSRLPLIEKIDSPPFIGDSTKTAIESGVLNGILHEIDGLITTSINKEKVSKIIITGGDAEFFARKLKNPIFVHSNIVLTGLNRILEHNA